MNKCLSTQNPNQERVRMRVSKRFRQCAYLGAGICAIGASAIASAGAGVTPYSSHGSLIGIRDAPVPYDDKDTAATVEAGIRFARASLPGSCGKNPYAKGIDDPCHPRHDTYVRTGVVLKKVLTKANIMPGDAEFERYRLTMVMEASRAGLEYVTAMSVSEDKTTHGVTWAQLEQHYSTSIDDPRTMSIYVDMERTGSVPVSRIRQAIDYVDAYRRGIYVLTRSKEKQPQVKADQVTIGRSVGAREASAEASAK